MTTRPPTPHKTDEIAGLLERLAEVRRSLRDCPRYPNGLPTWAAMDDIWSYRIREGLIELRLEKLTAAHGGSNAP